MKGKSMAAVLCPPASPTHPAWARFWNLLAKAVLKKLRTQRKGLLRSELEAWAKERPELYKPGRLLNALAHLANQRLAHAEVVAEELRRPGGELPTEAVRWWVGAPPKRVRLRAPGSGQPQRPRGRAPRK